MITLRPLSKKETQQAEHSTAPWMSLDKSVRAMTPQEFLATSASLTQAPELEKAHLSKQLGFAPQVQTEKEAIWGFELNGKAHVFFYTEKRVALQVDPNTNRVEFKQLCSFLTRALSPDTKKTTKLRTFHSLLTHKAHDYTPQSFR